MRTFLIRGAVAALGLMLIAPLAQAETAAPTDGPVVQTTAAATAAAESTEPGTGSATPDPTTTTAPTTTAPTTTAPTTTAPTTTTPAPSPATLTPAQALYVTPGYHNVNGRWWKTRCEMYSSSIVRCFTDIYATVIVRINNQWYKQNTWTFNNLTYLPSPESMWAGNRLASTGSWYAEDGRRWKSECNTAATGTGACRSYIWGALPTLVNGQVQQVYDWRFNGFVNFASAARPWVKTVPATVPTPSGVPSPSTPQPLVANPLTQQGFKLDSRCMTGRAFCVSKNQRKMAWVVNGKVDVVVDVRFGSELTPTRNGAFQVNWKSRDHVSSLYHTPMPYAMFFSGGQAIHYSADFARNGYNGASHGCVNVRDRAAIARLFDLARVGDKVIVYN
jgi:hypothetical protein